MKTPKFKISKVAIYTFLILLLLLSIVPFYLVTVNGTHSSFDIVTKLNLLPGDSLAENYDTMQSHVNIWRGFANSLLIAIPYTIITGYFGAFTAYGFAKYDFRGKKVAVVGGGNTAVSDLLVLAKYCAEVHLIHRRDSLRAARAGQLPGLGFKFDDLRTVGSGLSAAGGQAGQDSQAQQERTPFFHEKAPFRCRSFFHYILPRQPWQGGQW